MKIRENLWLSVKDGAYWSNFSGEWKEETKQEQIDVCSEAMTILRKRTLSNEQKQCEIDNLIVKYKSYMSNEEINKVDEELKKLSTSICKQLINFFRDVNFEPNFRFVNTLKRNASSYEDAKNYVCSYFTLSDNQFKDDISEKVKSLEFKDLIKQIASLPGSNKINKRFKVYYGSQGTGKTTRALKESNNVVMVCHSAMLPNDLLEDFKFENGQPCFIKSALWNAMENGTTITLDEINLLPFESLRFLQSILDNKESINYKGKVIFIKEGFKIIGTMNLVVNGSVFNLPEPLIDRAFELKEYKLEPEQLIGALI